MTKKRRPSLPDDYLDAALGGPPPRPAAGKASTRRQPARQPAPDRKVRATYHLPADLVEEARGAVVALAGPPVRLTLAALVESALRHELERLKTAHHRGKPWPRPSAPLVGGRPIKVTSYPERDE